LTAPQHCRNHGPERGQEAHVQHPIGLIQREYFDRGEVDRPPPQMIDETAGRRNDDVCAASQRLNLPAHTDTTEDGDEAKTRGRSVRRQRLMHLYG
jgi:hypothetical protein